MGLSWLFTLMLGAQDPAGTLSQVKGHVWLGAADGTEKPAAVGNAVASGTRIRTEAESLAEVKLADGSVLQVQAASELQLSKSRRQTAKSSLVLFFGKIWSRVAHAAGKEPSYEIKTANAVCGVRGTEFTTAVGDDGSLRVQVDKGQVEVHGDAGSSSPGAGEQVDADDQGVGKARGGSSSSQDWSAWQKSKTDRFGKQSGTLVGQIKAKLLARKTQLQALRGQERDLQDKIAAAKQRADNGDASAADEVSELSRKLAQVADAIADLGDETDSQVGLVDHFADLAKDARFANIDRKTLEAQAHSLRLIKADLDKMVADGTDISAAAMDQMMQEMRGNKNGTLKDKKGSTKDLFDDEMH